MLGGWWPRGQLASASLRSNISIYGALGHPVPPAPCSAGHGTRHGCPTRVLPSVPTSPFWDPLGLYPQDGSSQPSPHRVGRMRAGCSEAKCRIQACHGRAWGTRQRGKTCSAESPGARPCRRPAGVKAALAAAPAREVAAALAGGRFQGPWALGLGWFASAAALPPPAPPGTPPRRPLLGHPERARSRGDARAAGTIPGIPRQSGKTTSGWDLRPWTRTRAVGQGLIFHRESRGHLASCKVALSPSCEPASSAIGAWEESDPFPMGIAAGCARR